MSEKKKDPLDITDLPDKVEGKEDVKGGMASSPRTLAQKGGGCNTNTITCKQTSVGCD